MTLGSIRRLEYRKVRGSRRREYRNDSEHLLSSPENARVLREALEDARAGKGIRFRNVEELRRALGL